MPTFNNKSSLAVFCSHPESALIRFVMFALGGKLTTWSVVAQIQPIILLRHFCYLVNDVTSVHADFC